MILYLTVVYIAIGILFTFFTLRLIETDLGKEMMEKSKENNPNIQYALENSPKAFSILFIIIQTITWPVSIIRFLIPRRQE